ncbi:hypothetical protein MTBBW1_1380086 [Desulfamplus magnetovallimortis]|uniref:Uncharacterized protein n=1 Tax=Desulfamplus magnetovallimortis TaxID=1246637 RepID=A0A1W1H7U4_9BACT|nr:hypothetical protein MTBBW1_1380086 [Desulfamplus magnetovallimortis]
MLCPIFKIFCTMAKKKLCYFHVLNIKLGYGTEKNIIIKNR